MTQPNVEPALKPEAAHTIEHIGATLLRNGKYKDQVIYFGPMGCMTGFYLIVRDLDLEVIKKSLKMFTHQMLHGTKKFLELRKKNVEIIHLWI